MTDRPKAVRDPEQWRVVDEGWGRQAVEFAALAEPTNCREYVAMHHRLDLGAGDRLLDMACGSGLAIELATLRGARCAGIDASPRLIAVAQDRNPEADLRVGDMNALPWQDATFDLVTSFRGIWGTTPFALEEAYRVLTPGGRIGLTVWGHIKASPGAWVMEPFVLATEPKVQNQAAMVALGRPGAGEGLLADIGFSNVQRVDLPFVFEFADPEAYARAIASTGPAFEAIQTVGEEAFHDAAVELASRHVRDGLPMRAKVALVGYCFGGAVGVEFGATGAPLVANVSIHGSFRDHEAGWAKNARGMYLILHGAEDQSYPLTAVDRVIQELRAWKVPFQLEVYSGTGHGFSTPKNKAEERANAQSIASTARTLKELFGI